MNIQEFAIQHGFPISTTVRLVREAAERHVLQAPHPVGEGFTEIDELGVAFQRVGGRYRYRVMIPLRLAAAVVRRSDYKLFPQRALRRLADASRMLHEAAYQTHPTLRVTYNGGRFVPDAAYWAKLTWALELLQEADK